MLLDSALRTWGTREDLHMMLSKGLATHGAKSVLVFSEAPAAELRDRYEAEGIAVEVINYKRGPWHYYRRLGEVVRKHSVTAVHIAFFNYFDPLPWMARLNGVRSIIYHERNPGILRAKSWKMQLIRLRTRIASWPMTRVISISYFLERQLTAAGIPARKITVIHHGIDIGKYRPDPEARPRVAAEFRIAPGELIVVSLCYLMPHKNIDTLLQSCRILADRGVPVRTFIVGEGPLRGDLEALAKKLRLSDQVHWLGHIKDPVPLLQAADVFLLISEGEGFGLAIAEGMACGATAVASDSGALPEIVEDGKSGLVVPLRDAGALAEAIQKLACDEGLRRRLAQSGLERVRTLFSVGKSTQSIVDLYATALP
jgi:glycosyltransferase involved in cell wall biosynthesis